MKKKKLQSQLLQAFGMVHHPGNRYLANYEHTEIDIGLPYPYEMDTGFLYPYEGKPWHEIDKHELLREEACFSFLSDAGLLYVIPAYLYQNYNENGTFDSINMWEIRMLIALAEDGCGKLRLSAEQIRIIDFIFLTHLQQDWEKYGITAFGMNRGELIAKVRAKYAAELTIK